MRAPISRPLTLRSINRGSGMRLVQEGAEIWDGYIFVGEVSGEWLAQVVREKLDAMASVQGLWDELQSPTCQHYVKRPPAALPARVVPREIQEERRARRRGTRRRRP